MLPEPLPSRLRAARRRAALRDNPARLRKPTPSLACRACRRATFCHRTPEPSLSSGLAMSACRWRARLPRRACQVIGFDLNEMRIAELRDGRGPDARGRAGATCAALICALRRAARHRACEFLHRHCADPDRRSAPARSLGLAQGVATRSASALKRGDIVVYESTVYPGATEEDCVPVLERVSGLVCGQRFHGRLLAGAHQPGDRSTASKTSSRSSPGRTQATLDVVADVYGSVVTAGVHRAPSIAWPRRPR